LAERAGLTRFADYFPSDAVGCVDEVMADLLVQRLRGAAEEERLTERQLLERSAYPRDWDLYQKVVAMVKKAKLLAPMAVYHVLDYFTRPAAANAAEPLALKLLTTSRHEACATADAFLAAFGLPMLKAYGTLRVTFERDRRAAVTAVALAILASRFGEEMSAEELLRRAWVKVTAASSIAIIGIQPTIPDGERLLGLGSVKGTPILAGVSHGYPTCYKTASGGVYDTRGIMGDNLGLSFSDGVFTDAEGQRYHGFVCSPPSALAAVGAHKVLVWRREGDPARRPAIVQVVKDEDFSPPAAEEAEFD